LSGCAGIEVGNLRFMILRWRGAPALAESLPFRHATVIQMKEVIERREERIRRRRSGRQCSGIPVDPVASGKKVLGTRNSAKNLPPTACSRAKDRRVRAGPQAGRDHGRQTQRSDFTISEATEDRLARKPVVSSVAYLS